jgi:D-alanine-D-alanine ligase
MKVAIVYNRDSRNVINLFGMPNREKIGLKTIKRLADGLRQVGHAVRSFEGDKDLIDRLEDFMPRVLKGERPGMVFNVSYGIQGQARYTHVPGMLEMAGIPYVGSGPLAHSLALDKVVAKMIFKHNGISTPDFAVLDSPGFDAPDLEYPLIVKPKNEAVSFGLKIVDNEEELRRAADDIFRVYQEPVLAEQYIDGREINVGLLGNNPPDAFPPAELIFDSSGPPVYTYEDKAGRSGREIEVECPAEIDKELTNKAQDLARKAFTALGCYDCARVDMRLDSNGRLYVLELNSLPSLGEHGSYTQAAEKAGLDFSALVGRLVEVASARYFGTPAPPQIAKGRKDLGSQIFSFLVSRRDSIEKRVQEWTKQSSRTSDPGGLKEMVTRLAALMDDLGLKAVDELTDERCAWTWQTKAGLDKGILLMGHLDVPLYLDSPPQGFRRDPEWLFGEGIGASRAPLTMMEFALRSLRSQRRLRRLPLGVLYYTDEGRDGRYSAALIKEVAARAKKVIVLRPGNPDHHVVVERRGWRKFQLVVEDTPRRPGRLARKPEALRWINGKLEEFAGLSSRKNRLAVATTNLRTFAFPQLLPHRISATLLLSYSDPGLATETERRMREILGKERYQWEMELISDRPPMKRRKSNDRLVKELSAVAAAWEIPFAGESSLRPSVAGLVPSSASVVCGLGPIARDIDTPNESVQRISILQRTLLLSQFLVRQLKR